MKYMIGMSFALFSKLSFVLSENALRGKIHTMLPSNLANTRYRRRHHLCCVHFGPNLSYDPLQGSLGRQLTRFWVLTTLQGATMMLQGATIMLQFHWYFSVRLIATMFGYLRQSAGSSDPSPQSSTVSHFHQKGIHSSVPQRNYKHREIIFWTTIYWAAHWIYLVFESGAKSS